MKKLDLDHPGHAIEKSCHSYQNRTVQLDLIKKFWTR